MYSTDDLVQRAVQALRKMQKVEAAKVSFTTAELSLTNAGYEGLHAAKAEFLSRLLGVVLERTDLSQKQIGNDFGVSESFVRKTARRFAVPHRKRGPKPKRYTALGPKEETQ